MKSLIHVVVVFFGLVEILAAQQISMQRGAFPPAGQRGGGPRGSRTAPRIETRRYLFTDTNEMLEYAVFVSTKVDKKKKSPLVIALHGRGVPPALMLRMISDDAQDAGYIVAAPMGYNLVGFYGAAGPGGGRGASANLGELSEKDVMNVLDLLRKEFNVDERRIYLAGQSMGGAGALFLGIKHRTLWAAVAASAPAIQTQLHTPSDLEQAVDMPMILIHGDADPAVPVEQSRQWAAKMKSLGMTFEYHELRGGGHSDAIRQGARFIFKFFDKHVKPAATR
jgi:dipeptidyl aminopeptidase/acylaminoacyl peptidase